MPSLEPKLSRPQPIRFGDLSEGWRLTLLVEWACLGWILLSVAIAWFNNRTGWPNPEQQGLTFYHILGITLTRSILALGLATVLHFVCHDRPRVRFPLGWCGVVLAIAWAIFLVYASLPVF